MKIFFLKTALANIFLGLFLFTMPAFAQIPVGLGSQSLRLSAKPEVPAPHQIVLFQLNSLSTDLSSSEISWYKDGQMIENGVGNSSLTLRAGELGRKTKIEAVVRSVDGEFRLSKAIQPAEVDLIWESNSYVPNWYRGRSWLTSKNIVTFTAIPHITDDEGNIISPKNLVYTWKQGDKVAERSSGYGKQSFVVSNNLLKLPLEVSVEVRAPNKDIKVISATSIMPKDPILAVYQNDTLYGVLSNILIKNTFSTTNEEVSFLALPLFFNLKNPYESATYNWSVDDRPVTTQDNQATFRTTEKETIALVKIFTRNLSNVTQESGFKFNLIFKK